MRPPSRTAARPPLAGRGLLPRSIAPLRNPTHAAHAQAAITAVMSYGSSAAAPSEPPAAPSAEPPTVAPFQQRTGYVGQLNSAAAEYHVKDFEWEDHAREFKPHIDGQYEVRPRAGGAALRLTCPEPCFAH